MTEMQKIIFIILLAINTQFMFAQGKTLLDFNSDSIGWFCSPVIKYTQINNQDGVVLGVRGGIIYDHSFVLGAGMYGLATDINVDGLPDKQISENSDDLHLRYGGLELGYILFPLEIINFSINTLVGMGKVSSGNYEETSENSYFRSQHQGNAFFVVEPSVNLTANITTFFRLDLGISYLHVNGADYQNISDNKINGVNGFIALRFGNF